MDSDTPLDYALFQLSPRRSRCELFVSGDGKTEKLASGFLKPFTTHLKVAEEQASQAVQLIKLEVERRKNGGTWFNKGTLERFVRFVSTPEVLELVNTFDAEMSQLEGARKIYSQGAGDPLSGKLGERETAAAAAAADITKKELLRAIDVRLIAVKQDLTTACARASSAGFTLDNVSELLFFANHFGAHRLNEACTKFVSVCQRRPELVSHQHLPPSLPSQWKGFDEGNVRASSGSDMSIDEPEVETSGRKSPANDGGGSEFLKPSNYRETQASTAELLAASQQPKPIPRRFMEIQAEKVTEEPPAAPVAEPAQQAVGGGSSRRLSVQDRINLFESKQKEQAGNFNSSTGGGVSKVAAGRGEHRRLPSDVSVEKSVLRRWSGASDMSVELNNSNDSSCNERKESGSAAGTPTSVNFQAQSISKTEGKEASGSKDTAISRSFLDLKESPMATSASSSSSMPLSQAQVKAFPKDREHTGDEGTATSTTQSGPAVEKDQGIYRKNVSLGRMENRGLGDQAASQTRTRASSESHEGAGLKEHETIRTQHIAIPEEHVKNQAAAQIRSSSASALAEQVGQQDQEGLQSQPRDIPSRAEGGVKDQPTLLTQFRTFVRKTEDVEVKAKGPSDSRLLFKALFGRTEGISSESDLLTPQLQRKPFCGKLEEVGVKEGAASQAPFGSVPTKPKEDSGCQGTNLHWQSHAPDQIGKLQGRKDERAHNEGNAARVFPGKRAKENMEISNSPFASSMEQVQVARPSKGNQDLNDELQMKANELEKLFAAHKLRVQSDQMASSRRSKPTDVQVDHAPKSVEERAAVALPKQIPESNLVRENSGNGLGFDANLLLKMVDSRDYGNQLKQKLGSLGPLDDSRGKFYEKYMQKRDAKLREEWGSKRAQKEAKMKAMHDSLERSQAEMRAKFAGSADGQDLTHSWHRTEKLRSFNAHSALKNREQQALETLQGEEDDLQEFYEQVDFGQDKSYGDNLFSDGSSKSNNSRKLPSSKSLSSSTPRTSAASLPKSSTKATNTGSVKRRTQPENSLAQSVPNFSDFRKENTKPSAGISRVNTRVQPKNFSRSKSNCEEVKLAKEDKPHRSQSMRKSSVGPFELKDLSPLNSDSTDLTPVRFSKQTEPAFLNKLQKNGESKSSLRKGNGLVPAAGAGVAKFKASMVSEVLKDGDDFEEMVDQLEDSPDMVKDEELERTSAEGNPKATGFPADSDSEKPRLSPEFGNSDDPGSEDGDVPGSFSQADDDMAAVSTKFSTFAGNVQASPGESPGSWNSHIQHSFSYANETSDIDASVDSATGSPASWNSHPLNQMMEADAARMRKKWGSAQIPMLVANASQQPRKDVTKGFKRLLKFGRKSRGAESLITDWVSASTASEGDDDMEDGRDLATRSSDDLRKSRMGYPLSSYDGFNEGEVFPEQAQSLRSSIPNAPANFKLREDHLTGSSLKAPRSFFSLSTFRSKASESKLR